MDVQWSIIPPEIKHDGFYFNIINTIKKYKNHIRTILEIGASSGDGSTEALQLGKQGTNIRLYSLEVAKERFGPLQQRYKSDPNFFPLNVSSISVSEFPPKSKVTQFYQSTRTNLNQYPLQMVLGWYDNDINYVVTNKIEQNGITKAKVMAKELDCVLIDGSEFTGAVELNLVYGAKIIMLDDINAFKNYESNERLKRDPQYKCIAEDRGLRNGYAIYKRVDVPDA